MLYFWVVIIIWNIYAYLLMGIDKQRARKKKRRISEKTLFLISFFGGAVGILIGMRSFRHKTQHPSFTRGVPSMLVLNVIFLTIIIYLWGLV